MLNKILILLMLFTLLVIVAGKSHTAQDERSLLTIYQENTVGRVNKGLFGNNLYVDSPSQNGGFYENSGGGIWNPKHYKLESKLVTIAKNLGITSFRWPGGNRARHFNWKLSVGPVSSRKSQQFGLPEFLLFCKATEATPIITLSALKDTPDYFAELVEYLNAPADGSNPNGGIDWALVRKNDGRESPWNVKWFEYGNETYNTNVSIETYIKNFNITNSAMKLVDSSIKLGVVLEDSNNFKDGWTYSIIKKLGNVADFGIIHMYQPVLESIANDKVNKYTVALAAVSSDAEIEYRLKRYKSMISELIPDNEFPLVVSEYNGHYPYNDPIPYRFTLFNSLRNADMLRVFMNPEYNIVMANYWLFINAHWGMLFNNDKTKMPVKQSDALMFEIFNNYLGDDMLENQMITSSFEFSGAIGIAPRLGHINENNGNETPISYKNKSWKTRRFTDGEQEQLGSIVKVSFNKEVDANYYHAYKTIDIEPDTLYRIKVQIKAESIVGGKVGVLVEDSRGWKKTFNQASNMQISGTTNGWKAVTAQYHTLSDAKKINIVARRIGGKGMISGNAYFGDVEITKIVQNYGSVPSLSVITTNNSSNENINAIIINKNMYETVPLSIAIDSKYEYIINSSDVLSGHNPFSTNYLVDEDGVTIMKSDIIKNSKNTFSINIPPASIAGIKLMKNAEGNKTVNIEH